MAVMALRAGQGGITSSQVVHADNNSVLVATKQLV
tara:strand:+ start:170 stop:274 length:105 start_codon:yes stop_codon:yes gene_type:complete